MMTITVRHIKITVEPMGHPLCSPFLLLFPLYFPFSPPSLLLLLFYLTYSETKHPGPSQPANASGSWAQERTVGELHCPRVGADPNQAEEHQRSQETGKTSLGLET